MNMVYMMENEINSQEKVIQNLINDYISNNKIKFDLPLNIKKIKIIASGSSYNAGLFAKVFFEKISNVEADVEHASEFSNTDSMSNSTTPDKIFNTDTDSKTACKFEANTLFIFISQSGNSFDTVKSFELINNSKDNTPETLSITNNKDSILYKNCTYKFYLNAQKEQAIGATKTFSASVFALWLIALKIAQNKKIDIKNELKSLENLSESIKKTIKNPNKLKNFDLITDLISKQKNFPIIGSKEKYALSKEASLKIKEINYINTTAYPIGEFVHGHFAILNKSKILLVFLFGSISSLEIHSINKILFNYKKIKLIIISDNEKIKKELQNNFKNYLKEKYPKKPELDNFHNFNDDIILKIPSKINTVSSAKININTLICSIILAQLLSLHTAIKLNRNVDKPKGLEKVVK